MPNEWRDIESAPKDGSIVLVFSLDFREPIIAWWRDDDWRETWDNNGELEPSHWMPLPEPLGGG